MSQEGMGGQEGAPAGSVLVAGVDYLTPAAVASYVAANAAPIAAQYLVLAAHAALTTERVFTPSTGLTAQDGGVGAAYTVTVDLATGKAGGQTVYGGTGAGENLTLSSTFHATKGKVYLGSALTVWVDGVDGNTRFNVDCTGLTTTVPALVKNGKPLSGIEVQVTGTAATGFALRDAAGTLRGSFGYAVSASDWIAGTAAGDVVLSMPNVGGGTARLYLANANLAGGFYVATGASFINLANTIGTQIGFSGSSLTVAGAGVTIVGNLVAPTVYGSAAASGNLTLASTTHATPGNVTMTSGSAGTLSQFVASAASGTKMSYGPSVSLTMAGSSAFVGAVTITSGGLTVNGVTTIDSGGGITMLVTALATGATTGFPILRTIAGPPTGAVADGAFAIDPTGSKLWARVGGAWKSVAIA